MPEYTYEGTEESRPDLCQEGCQLNLAFLPT
jgi:hypothetical protein